MTFAIPDISFGFSAHRTELFHKSGDGPPRLSAQSSAVSIVDAKLLAVAVPKIKLSQVALQMRFADVLIHAVNSALKDQKKPSTPLVVMTRVPSRRTYSSLL
jgi:hypothetical protein